MIKLEIQIKEETIQDFGAIEATVLNINMKEKSKKETEGEREAVKLYKKLMGFDNNLMVVNKCKNETEFEKIKEDLIKENV